MGRCSLYYGEHAYGQVTWQETERGLQLTARCPYEQGMIYRVVLQTENGLVPLGVMLPEGQEFILRKEIMGPELPVCGYIDRKLPGESHLPGLPVALSAFSEIGQGLLSAHWMDVQYLLFSLEVGNACSGVQFLAIAKPLEQNGKLYGLFCQRNGQYLPYSDSLCNPPVIR